MARPQSTRSSAKGTKRAKPQVVVKGSKLPVKQGAPKVAARLVVGPAFKPTGKPTGKTTDRPTGNPAAKPPAKPPAKSAKATLQLPIQPAAIVANPVAASRIATLSNPVTTPRASFPREAHAMTAIAPAIMSTPRALPDTLVERYELVKSRIASAARRSDRRLEDILLVAVTKYATPEQVRELLTLGHRDLGENRVQHLLQQAAMVEEYQSRLKALPATRKAAADAAATLFDTVSGKPGVPDPASTSARWHMIGHLQRNKAKKIVEIVRLTHSVDSLRVAEELQILALKKDRVIDVLIQVNCSGEEQKYGCPIPATIPLAEQIGSMINVRVRGLMTMAAYSDKPEDARETFARCRELFEELKASGVVEGPVNILSMGMTGDFEVAIEEGANCVRIGSAIFGEPPASTGQEAESDEE